MSNFYTDLIENRCIRVPNKEEAENLLNMIRSGFIMAGKISVANLLTVCQVPENVVNHLDFLTDYCWYDKDDFRLAYDVEYAPGYKVYWISDPRLDVPMPVEPANLPSNSKPHRAKVKVIQAMDRSLFEKSLAKFLQTIPEYWPSIFYTHNSVFDGKNVQTVYIATIQYCEEVDENESND